MFRTSTMRVVVGSTLCATLAVGLIAPASAEEPEGVIGPDVVYSDCVDIVNHGNIGGIRAYTLGSYTCNIGDQNLKWGFSWEGTPYLAMNAYRLHDGRLVQLGMSWCKQACCAAAGNGCNLGCNGVGGSHLGVGCRDIYTAGWNSGQSSLGPRSMINAYTGTLSGWDSSSGNAIYKRLQIPESDLVAANFPGALYFVEGVYVGTDDAQAGNHNNNASYKRVTVAANFNLSPTGAMHVGLPAIYAWRDHGNGVGQPDNSVEIVNVDVPNEGRFVAASKVKDNGNGTWRYEYAVFNISSHRSGGSLSIPIAAGTTISNAGFHDVDYHSGEPYDNTDWTINITANAVTWQSPQTYEQNQNSNALRWGTMYNFWFDADQPPADGQATLGLFRPGAAGDPASVDFPTQVPANACFADVSGDGAVNVTDLLAVISAWGPCTGKCPADVVPAGVGDGQVNVEDLLAVISAWGPCK